MNGELFLSELSELLRKHDIWLSGTVRIREIGEWDKSTASCNIGEVINYGYATDKSGPFLQFQILPVEKNYEFNPKAVNTQILDRDKLLVNGVLSPLDGKSAFHNRREWGEHLKANNCVEYGNDLNNHKAPTEVRGDFDCRKELTEATHRILG